MAKNDGGPAYPAFLPGGADSYFPGKTLRDWFAGQALMGAVAREGILAVGRSDQAERTAADAYALADAMLVEREKGT